MKKLIFTLMTLAVIMASAAIALAAGEVYTLREAIEGDTEQGPEWSYLSSVDGGEWQELYYTPDWGDNWQYSDTPDGVGIYYSIYLSEGKLMAEAGVRDGVSYAVAARFTAPRDGELVIAPWRHILTTYDGMYEDESGITVKPITDGYINAVIRKNGEELYRAATDGSLVSSAELKTSVVTGDELWFIVEPGEGAEGDALMNDVAVSYGAAPEQPAITLSLPQSYGGDGVYSLHDAYMGDAEQGPDWFYLKRYGAGTWEELNYYPDYGDNWQVSSKPDEDAIYYSLCDWNGVSAQAGYDILEGKPYEIAAAFKAPEGGTLKIAPWRHIMFSSSGMEAGLITYEPYEGNLYSAEIRKNDEVIYSKMLSGGYQESPPLDIFVEAGDMIYFAFNPRELVDVAFETPTLRMDDILVGYEGVTFKPLAELPEVFAQDLPEPSEPAASEEAAPEPAPEEPESAEAGAATEEPASEEAGAEAAQPASGTQGVPLAVIVTVVLVILVIAAVIITRRRK
ncbi:MAG: hypothetical protein LBS62_08540 [Clostridiales bacterium]|jgi:hypothetical protein|nr:hypothetical protein [Clostridiales bacterium]